LDTPQEAEVAFALDTSPRRDRDRDQGVVPAGAGIDRQADLRSRERGGRPGLGLDLNARRSAPREILETAQAGHPAEEAAECAVCAGFADCQRPSQSVEPGC